MEEEKMVPKHRFDYINTSLKEYKEKVKKYEILITEFNNQKQYLNDELEKVKELKKDYLILIELCKHRAKNIVAVKALLKLSDITIENGQIIGLFEQIKTIKKNEPYLFDGEITYILKPYRNSSK